MTLTPGDAVDYSRVKDDILAICDGLALQGFAFDPLFQAEWLTQQISEETGADRHEFRQVITEFSPPMKTLGRLIAERKVRHNGNQIFTWQLGHLACYEDVNGNQRPVRQKRGDLRTIDGPVACIMAMGLLLASEVSERPTFYDRDDVEVEFL
jgi:phage terminase large subunit-like protein